MLSVSSNGRHKKSIVIYCVGTVNKLFQHPNSHILPDRKMRNRENKQPFNLSPDRLSYVKKDCSTDLSEVAKATFTTNHQEFKKEGLLKVRKYGIIQRD